MNKIYKLIWSKKRETWVAVSEKVASGWFHRPLIVGSLALAALLVSFGSAKAIDPGTLPTGGQVVAGQANISQSGASMTINQSTDKMIANWNTFNIGRDASVRFQQPGASSVALNRILDQNPSQIFGRLSANGQIFLMNPAGVYFGPTAQVDVGGLVASSLNLSNENFLAGKYHFENMGTAGAITNQGIIRTASGGYVAFLSPKITNEGNITAPGGTTALAAGDKVSLDFTGDKLVTFTVDQGAIDSLIENKGLIKADGGLVMLSAKAADALTQSVVNNEGIIEAQTLENRSGRILLLSDMESGETIVGGRLDASAPNGGDGGFIETSGAKVNVKDDTKITTDAPYGNTGLWLIDPKNYTIVASGGDITGANLSGNLGSSNVTIQSSSGATEGSGDIIVNDTVNWGQNKLTLTAYRNIYLKRSLNGSGTASLALEYGQGAAASGNTADYYVNAPVNLPAGYNFSTKLGSDGTAKNYKVITALGAAGSTTGNDLQGINGNRGGNYALGANIDASATSSWNSNAGFTAIGGLYNPFKGSFEGLGHTISGLTINRPGTEMQGLFGYTSGARLRNIGLVNADVTGSNYVGALAGRVYTSKVTNSYATGSVTGDVNVGGLIGKSEWSDVINSYAMASVTGNQSGGLVGFNSGAKVINSYATGLVTGSVKAGGLVGYHAGDASLVQNSYWDKESSGRAWSAAGTGKTTAEMKQQATFTGWDFDNTWLINEGQFYPMLRSLQRDLIVTANDFSKTYNRTAYSGGNGVSYSASGASLSGTLSYSGASQGAVNAGSYLITPGGFGMTRTTQQDYQNWTGTIVYASGALTITPKAITATGVTAASKVYDGNATATINTAAAVITGGAAADDDKKYYTGDTVVLEKGAATGAFADKNVGTSKPVTVTGFTLSGAQSGNYTVSDASGATADITAKPITISGITASNKVYDGTTNATVDVSNAAGWIFGDAVSVSATGTFNNKNVGTDKTVTVSGVTLAGADKGNYTLSGASDAKADITRLASVVWTGGETGEWFNPANWAGSAIPDLANVAAVTIPGTVTVNFDDTQKLGLAEAGTVDLTSVTGAAATLTLQNANRLNTESINLKQLTMGDSATLGLTGGTNTLTTQDGLNIGGSLVLAAASQNTITSSAGISITSPVTQSGGTLALSAGSANDITLDNAGNDFTGTVSVSSGKNVSLKDKNSLTLGGMALSGALTAEALGGNLTVGSPMTWSSTDCYNLKASNAIYVNAAIENTNTTSGGVFFAAYNTTDKVIFGAGGKVIIHNVEQLQWMNTAQRGKYELGGNIDASATSGWNDGAGFDPVPSSSGSFDGKGYTISGLTINRPTTTHVGLFGYLQNSTIKNVGLTGSAITGKENVGSLVGYGKSANIANSYAAGTVTGAKRVGGLAGVYYGGTITNSYSNVTVSKNVDTTAYQHGGLVGILEGAGSIERSFATGTVQGYYYSGGLVGYNNDGAIKNSYATGGVTGVYYVGGLTGISTISATILNSYAVGAVSGTNYLGGLVGQNTGTVTSSFYNSETTGQSDNTGKGTPKATAEMMTQATFSGWDFSTIWKIEEGFTYPYHTWRYPSGVDVVSGIAVEGATNPLAVDLYVNTTLAASTQTGANGFYHFLLDGASLADGDYVLAKNSGNTAYALAKSDGGHLTGFGTAADTLTLHQDHTDTLNNTWLSNAKATLVDLVPYTATDGNITLTSGVSFAAADPFELTGKTINTGGGGGITFKDTLTVSADTTLSTGAASAGNILFAGAVNSDAGQTRNLTLEAGTGDVTFSSPVGATNALNNLTVSSSNNVTAENAANNFTGMAAVNAIGNVSIKDKNALTLGASTVGGSYTAQALGGNLTIAGDILKTGGADATATFKATGSILLSANKKIESTSSILNTILWSDSDANGGGITLNSGSFITTNGGHLWMGGGSESTSWNSLTVGNGYALGTSGGNGIYLAGAGLNSGAGNLSLKGEGYYGIYGYGATSVIETSTGSLTLEGRSQAASGHQRGVVLNYAKVRSAGGAILVQGTSRGTTTTGWQQGVRLENAAEISNSGLDATATVTVIGNGGAGSQYANGISLNNTATIKANGGTLTMTGTGGSGMGGDNNGIALYGGSISNTGTGADATVTITGTGGTAGDNNHGVYLQASGTSISTAGGALGITGTAGSSGVNSQGIKTVAGSTLTTGVSCARLTLTSDTLSLAGSVSGTGNLLVQPKTTATTIGVADGAGTLQVPASYFATNFSNGFANITVGNASAGNITVGNTALTYRDPLTLKTGGNITGANASLTGGAGENASLALWANADGNGGNISLTGSAVTTNGAHLWMGGGSGSTTWKGLIVGNGAAIGNEGIYLENSTLATGAGDSYLYGRSARSDAGYGIGVYLYNGTQLSGNNITIIGEGSTANTGGRNFGLSIQDSNAKITGTGAIQITGTGGGSADDSERNHGVLIRSSDGGTVVEATGAGTVTITGTGGLGANNSHGIVLGELDALAYRSGNIVTESGAITLTGTKGAGAGSKGLMMGSVVASASKLQSTAGGAINITTDTFSTAGTLVKIQSSGALTVKPKTAGSTVGIGGETGTLQLPATFFSDNLVDGFSGITVGSATTGKITAGAFSPKDNLTLQSGAGGMEVTGALNAGANTLTLNTTGNVSDSGAGAITADKLALLGSGGVYTLDSATNNVGTLAANTGSIKYVNIDGLTLGGEDSGIEATGQINMATLEGDLTIANNITTTNCSDSAIVLNASKNTAAGTSTGGNVIISGTPAISIGAGGRATLYTGSLAGSTGLAESASGAGDGLIAFGSGRFRYGSDETTSNYTAAMGTGNYAIYREKPEFVITTADKTGVNAVTYGDALSFTPTLTGSYVNGDTVSERSGSPTWTVSGTPSASGLVTAGDHTITYDSGYSSAYGYGYTAGAAATLTVNKKALGIAANNDSKFVGRADVAGFRGVSYSGFVNGETASGLIGASELTVPTISRTNAGTDVAGEYAGVLKPDGATATNYSISYTNGNYTIIPAQKLQIKVANLDKTYGSAPDYTISSVQYLFTGDVVVDLTESSKTGNTYVYNDGASGTVTFTLTPDGVATSTSGNIKAGNYEITVKDFSKTTANLTSNEAVVSGALSVSQKALTPSVDGGLTKTYDATKNMTGLTLGLTGTITNDLVSAGGTGEYKQANAGNNLDYTVNVSLAGVDKGNYFLNSATLSGANGVIAPKALTVTGTTAANKVYDGTKTAAITVGTLSGFVNSQTVSATATGLFDSKDAGARTATATYALADGQNGGLAGNYTLANTQHNATISQKYVNLSGSRTYDGTVDVAAGILTVGNLVGTETLILSGGGKMTDKHVGTDKAISDLNTLALGNGENGGLADNYTFNGGTHKVTINKADLTVSTDNVTKTYDGNTTATGAVAKVTSGTLFSGDSLAGGSFAFADKNAGTNKTVTVSGVTVSDGNAGGNYNLTLADNTTGTINKRAVNLSGSRTYDGKVDVAAGILTVGNLVGTETLILSGGGKMTDKHVGTDKAISDLNTLALANGDNGGLKDNYTLTGGSHKVTINKADLTVSTDNVTKIYDGTTSAADAAAKVTSGTLFTGDSLAGGSFAFADKDAGPGNKTVTVSGVTVNDANSGGNYNLTLADNYTSTISAKELTISGITASNKTYDGTAEATTSSTGATYTGLLAGDSVTVAAIGTFDNKNVGDGKTVTLDSSYTGDDVNNYTMIDQETALADITKASLTISTPNVTKTYDGTSTAAGTATVTSGTLFDTDSISGGTFAFTNKNAGIGNKTVTISGVTVSDGNAGGNYTVTYADNTESTINPYAVSLTGTRNYDGTKNVAADILTIGSLVGSETLTLSGAGTMADKHAGAGKLFDINTLTLGNGTGTATNYTLTGGTRTVDINKADLTISTENVTKTYDGTTAAAGTVTAINGTQVFAGDTLSGGTFAFTNKNAGIGNKTVTVSGVTVSDGNAGGNYTVTYADNTTSTISPKELTISGITASNKTYDGTVNATVSTAESVYTGLVENDKVSVSATGLFADKNAYSGITVYLTSSYTGDDVANYAITDQATTTADITKKDLSVAGTTASDKIYDGNTNAAITVGTLSGFVGTETVTATATGVFDSKNAGSRKAEATYTLQDGENDGLADNYSLANTTDHAATITKLALTGSIAAGSSTYGSALVPGVVTLTNKVEGDVLTPTASVDTTGNTSTSGNLKAGSYNGIEYISALGGADASNYTFANVKGDYTVNKLVLTGTAIADVATTYGTPKATGAVSFTNIQSKDGTFDKVASSASLVEPSYSTSNNLKAGSYKQTATAISGDDAANYSFTAFTSEANYTIHPKALILSGITAADKIYDSSTAATVSTSGSVYTGMVENDKVSVSATGTFDNKNVGENKTVNLTSSYTGDDVTNYTITDQATTTADITPAPLTVTANDKTKTYGDTVNFTGTEFISAGLIGDETIGLVTLASLGADAKAAVAGSPYAITASDAQGGTFSPGNYAITYKNGTLTVNKALLDIKANDDNKTYSGVPYYGGNGVIYAGFVGGETSTVLSGALHYGGTSQGAITASKYGIDPFGLTSKNYAIKFINGVLTITGNPVENVDAALTSVLNTTDVNQSQNVNAVAFNTTIRPGSGNTTLSNISNTTLVTPQAGGNAILSSGTFSAPVTTSTTGQTITLLIGNQETPGSMTEAGMLPVYIRNANAQTVLQGNFLVKESNSAISLTQVAESGAPAVPQITETAKGPAASFSLTLENGMAIQLNASVGNDGVLTITTPGSSGSIDVNQAILTGMQVVRQELNVSLVTLKAAVFVRQ